MASSLIGGLLNADTVKADQIVVFEPSADRAAELAAQFKVRIAKDNSELTGLSDIAVIAVKPQVLQTVLAPLGAAFQARQPLIISIVAGIQARSIEQWLTGEFAVVRVMPNTPALIGAGASGLYANARVTAEQRHIAVQLLSAVGSTAWVNSEANIDSVTALSGSGPAYFMLFIQSLVDAAVAAGLDPETAKLLAVKTASGAAQLIESSDLSVQTLIENVTSPGGTTEQALKSFHQSNLPDIVTNAFNAAKRRSEELAAELG